MQETRLSVHEKSVITNFTEQLVEYLATLYIEGENNYVIEDEDKITSVIVDRTVYALSPEAMKVFEGIHDEWEINICQKDPHDVLVGGLYSRGKSHILRLAVPIQLLINFWETVKEDTAKPLTDGHDGAGSTMSIHADGASAMPDDPQNGTPDGAIANPAHQDVDLCDDDECETEPSGAKCVGPQAIQVACSLVKTCLEQLCILNGKSFLINHEEATCTGGAPPAETAQSTSALCKFAKLYATVIRSPGKVVSLTLLNQKGTFRKTVDGYSGKGLMSKIANDLPTLGVGTVESFFLASNKSQVYYFVKDPVPENGESLPNFVQKLANVALNIQEYAAAYNTNDSESERHAQDYEIKKMQHSNSPSKRPRLM